MIRVYTPTSWMFLAVASAALVLFAACPPFPHPIPHPTPAPSSTPTVTPTPAPSPRLASSGRAEIILRGLDRLPLGDQPGEGDLFTMATLLESATPRADRPVVQIAIRGAEREPCLQRPCRRAAGLSVRWSASPEHDRSVDWTDPAATGCGGDTGSYHARLAIGEWGATGSVPITLEWSATSIRVATPVDSATWALLHPGSMQFGALVEGAPWERREAPGWAWNSVPSIYGAGIVLTAWDVFEAGGAAAGCP
jgi:hypothetical protein